MWLPDAVREVLFSQGSPERFCMLVTISNTGWEQPLRFTPGPSITSLGEVFRMYPVRVRLPERSQDGHRPGLLRAATTPEIMQLIEQADGPIAVDISWCTASSPDLRFARFPRGRITSPRVTADELEADIWWPAWSTVKVPRHVFSPVDFRALF